MGYLDNTTTTVDAILTKKGRELLANNDDSFSLTFFALGDDEVDYSTIKQYGRTVGKEKVEKKRSTSHYHSRSQPQHTS